VCVWKFFSEQPPPPAQRRDNIPLAILVNKAPVENTVKLRDAFYQYL